MKKKSYVMAIFFMTSLFLKLSAFSVDPQEALDTKPYITKVFQLDEPGELKIKTYGGSIRVNGHASADVKVQMYVRMIGSGWQKASESDMDKALYNYDIEITKEGNIIYARAEPKNKARTSKNNISISFTVYVPYEISSDLLTSGGSIIINGLKGNQKLITSGGSIHCNSIDGNVKANTSGGSILIEDYEGELDASTGGGAIKLKNANGNLKIHTSEGGISLKDVSGSVEAVTLGGSITANLLRLDHGLVLSSSGGSIFAIVPSGVGVDLNLCGPKVNTQLNNFTGKSERNKIIGSMNGGGIPVSLVTTGGNIDLEFRN